MPRICIVLPVFNEEDIIEENAEKLCSFLDKAVKDDFEIIIADNGSTDATLQKARILEEKYDYLRCIHLNLRGRGRALKKAWSNTDAEIISYMDADLSTDLKAFPELIGGIDEGFDIVVGSRFTRGASVKRSLWREFLSRGYTMFLRSMVGPIILDPQCGFKAMKKSVFDVIMSEVEDDNWFFDTELLVKAKKRGFKIKEIPVQWVDRGDGKTKVDYVDTIFDYIFLVLKLKYALLFKSHKVLEECPTRKTD